MTLNEYQKQAHKYAIYEHDLYPFLGLASEAGEVCGKVSKLLRDTEHTTLGYLLPEERLAISKELGDTLWQLTEAAGVIDMSLEDIAESNLFKLADRKARGKLGGSGDNR